MYEIQRMKFFSKVIYLYKDGICRLVVLILMAIDYKQVLKILPGAAALQFKISEH